MNQGELWSWRSAFYDLMFRNMIDLRDDLSVVVGHIPLVWAVLIKFVIPPILLALFSLGCAAKTPTGETGTLLAHYPHITQTVLSPLANSPHIFITCRIWTVR